MYAHVCAQPKPIWTTDEIVPRKVSAGFEEVGFRVHSFDAATLPLG